VNLARRLGLDAESTLRHASAKFERRFRVMEAALAEADGRGLAALTTSELEALWVAAKARD
jgi:ATP diphosphatase